MNSINDLRNTTLAKTDQANACDLLVSGPMTITVTNVKLGTDEQPVIIHYQGDDGRPFKPSKTVRRILILGWGEDGEKWVGRSMTIYTDPTVKFGKDTVGGIRVSHMSHIDRAIEVSLPVAKGKKTMYRIERLVIDTGPALADVLAAIAAATNKATMDAAKAMANKLTVQADIDAAVKAYGARVAAIKAAAKPAAAPAEDQTVVVSPQVIEALQKIAAITNVDDLAEYLDSVRDTIPPSMQDEVAEAGRARMEQLAG